MKRRSIALAAALVFLLPGLALAEGSSSAKSGGDAPSGRWGLLFSAKNLLALDGFEDRYQAGAGVKFWATPSIAARGLLCLDHNTAPDSGPSRTTVGLGLAGEWHPSRGAISPYVGALFGTRALARTDQETAIAFYFGGIFGAEAKLLDAVSFFAEYELVASVDATGFSVNLGTGNLGGGQAIIGFAIYF
jgi:hypothetical protein